MPNVRSSKGNVSEWQTIWGMKQTLEAHGFKAWHERKSQTLCATLKACEEGGACRVLGFSTQALAINWCIHLDIHRSTAPHPFVLTSAYPKATCRNVPEASQFHDPCNHNDQTVSILNNSSLHFSRRWLNPHSPPATHDIQIFLGTLSLCVHKYHNPEP